MRELIPLSVSLLCMTLTAATGAQTPASSPLLIGVLIGVGLSSYAVATLFLHRRSRRTGTPRR